MSKNNIEENSEFVIIFKPEDENTENVRIFGEIFVYNNQDKCKILYKGKEYELKEFFEDIDNNYNHKDEILFKLKEIKCITIMSYLFHNCNHLSSLLIFQKNNFLKITKKIDERLSESNSSISLDEESEKSNWNTLSEIEKNDFYYGCNPLFFNELSTILNNKSSYFNDNNETIQMNTMIIYHFLLLIIML